MNRYNNKKRKKKHKYFKILSKTKCGWEVFIVSKPFFALHMPLFLMDSEKQMPLSRAKCITVYQNKWTLSLSPIRMTPCFGFTCYEYIKSSQCDCPFKSEIIEPLCPDCPEEEVSMKTEVSIMRKGREIWPKGGKLANWSWQGRLVRSLSVEKSQGTME